MCCKIEINNIGEIWSFKALNNYSNQEVILAIQIYIYIYINIKYKRHQISENNLDKKFQDFLNKHKLENYVFRIN